MLTNADVSARIKELVSAVAEKVIAAEIRRRNWRVQVLQERVDKILELSLARAKMYAEQKDEGFEFTVANRDEEAMAIEEGCRARPVFVEPPPPAGDGKNQPKEPPPPPPEYPKTMIHPGYPNGAATGLLMKDFRGKNAEQVIWNFDSGLESRLADNLKQAAIEEGQWTEKRDFKGTVSMDVVKARLNAGRQRVADARIAREAAAAKAKAKA